MTFNQEEFDTLSVQDRAQIMAETIANLFIERSPNAVFIITMAEIDPDVEGPANSYAVTHTNMAPGDTLELLDYAREAMERQAEAPILNQ